MLAGILLARPAPALDLVVAGSLLGVAEFPLDSTQRRSTQCFQSAPDQVLLSVCNAAGPRVVWRVDVRRRDAEWPRGLKLEVRRTGDGVGPGLLMGRRGYAVIGLTTRTLCSGTGNRAHIPLQFRLSGPALEFTAGTHACSLVYTVIQMGR
jgi:hypothetical protein